MENIKSIKEFIKNYELLDTIGKSDISVIKKIKLKSNNKHYIAKIIDKNKENNIYNEYWIIKELTEVPNIIQFYSAYEDDLYFLLVFELLKTPDIAEYLDKNGPLKLLNVKKIVYVLATTLKHLHKKKIAHLDIKPDNIMCDFEGRIKLIDFGLSKHLKDMIGTCCGTIYYISPEIIQSINKIPIIINCKTDIWSLGITMYVMLFKEYPFYSKCNKQVSQMIMNVQFDDIKNVNQLDINTRNLLKLCLKKNPTERISAEEILNHEWFKKDFI
jgi:serine/threonine protein kinase